MANQANPKLAVQQTAKWRCGKQPNEDGNTFQILAKDQTENKTGITLYSIY